MADQLYYNGERATQDNFDVSLPRGDDRHLVFTHVLAAAEIKEIRWFVKDSDGTVVTALNGVDDAAQIDVATDYECEILIVSADTVGLDVSAYNHAVEFVDQSDYKFTVIRGAFEVTDDIVDDTGTAPYLSWNTRADLDSDIDDLEADIEGMATCGNVSWLTTAIVGGEGVMYVQNGEIFQGTPNIRLELDDGTTEDDSVASQSGNTLTLSGTISGVAAIGRAVRIL